MKRRYKIDEEDTNVSLIMTDFYKDLHWRKDREQLNREGIVKLV